MEKVRYLVMDKVGHGYLTKLGIHGIVISRNNIVQQDRYGNRDKVKG